MHSGKTNSFAHTMRNWPNLDKPLLLNLFVSHRNLYAFDFSDKLKPFRNGLLKLFNKPTEATYDLCRKKKKHFTDIKITWFRIILKNNCCFPTFNHTMNKMLNYFRILIQQTWFKMIYILYTITLDLMIMFFCWWTIILNKLLL